MNNIKPFVHVLKSPYSHYVYDVNTDSVLKISEELYDYLLDLEHGLCPDNTDCLNREINELNNNGYLKTFHPKGILDPRLLQLEYLLNNRIEGITLQVTQKCNMRCSYCSFTYDNVNSRTHTSKSMDYGTAIKAIDFYFHHSRDSKLINVSFYGGEPLLEYEMIKKLIEYVYQRFEGKEISFNVTTNAILLTPERLKFLVNNNVNVMVSIDGPADIHNKSRKLAGTGKGSYDLIVKQLEQLKKKCPEEYNQLTFNSVIDSLNDITELTDFYNHDIFQNSLEKWKEDTSLNAIGGDFSINTPVMETPEGTSAVASECFYISERASGLIAMYSLIGIAEKKYINPIALNIEASLISENNSLVPTVQLDEYSPKGGPCIPGVHGTFIRIDGEFFPCEKASDTSKALNIGNIDIGYDFEKIKEMLNIGKLTEKKCVNCWAIRHCSSCVIHGNMMNKISRDMLFEKCPSIQSHLEASLQDLIALDELRPILLKHYSIDAKEVSRCEKY